MEMAAMIDHVAQLDRAAEFYSAGWGFESSRGRHTAAELDIAWRWHLPPPLNLNGFRQALKRAWREQFGVICQDCNREMAFEQRNQRASNYATIDHILARGLGGTCDLNNIRVICLRCNGKKSKREGMEAHAVLFRSIGLSD
jgi:5-methylcytosine-specific restriction endonuclease McrA